MARTAPTLQTPRAASAESSTCTEFPNQVLQLFRDRLPDVTFPGVSVALLEECAAAVVDRQQSVAFAQDRLLQAEAECRSSQDAFARLAERAVAYLQVFAAGDAELEQAVLDLVPRRAGRPSETRRVRKPDSANVPGAAPTHREGVGQGGVTGPAQSGADASPDADAVGDDSPSCGAGATCGESRDAGISTEADEGDLAGLCSSVNRRGARAALPDGLNSSANASSRRRGANNVGSKELFRQGPE